MEGGARQQGQSQTLLESDYLVCTSLPVSGRTDDSVRLVQSWDTGSVPNLSGERERVLCNADGKDRRRGQYRSPVGWYLLRISGGEVGTAASDCDLSVAGASDDSTVGVDALAGVCRSRWISDAVHGPGR